MTFNNSSQRELAQIPDDQRSTFYLAQSYKDANEVQKAIEKYSKRIELGGCIEEVFYSYLQLGLLFLHVKDDTKTAEKHLLDAAKTNPQRYAEVAYPLVKYYRSKKDYTSAVFWGCSSLPSLKVNAKAGINTSNYLFYQKDIYTWRLKDELSLALYYFDTKPFAKKLMEELLDEAPIEQRERIKQNLKHFK
jgi:tetratricopeptide (TPR) repeat protein|tara:strand:- start:841 stop:1413 length:573 start_codon:yes stop_codon:yes gene_type:complete